MGPLTTSMTPGALGGSLTCSGWPFWFFSMPTSATLDALPSSARICKMHEGLNVKTSSRWVSRRPHRYPRRRELLREKTKKHDAIFQRERERLVAERAAFEQNQTPTLILSDSPEGQKRLLLSKSVPSAKRRDGLTATFISIAPALEQSA